MVLQLLWCNLDCSPPGGGMVSQQVKAKPHRTCTIVDVNQVFPHLLLQFSFTTPLPLCSSWPSISLHPISPLYNLIMQLNTHMDSFTRQDWDFQILLISDQLVLFHFKLLMSSFISTPPILTTICHTSVTRGAGRSRGDLSNSYLSLCVAALNSLP